MGRSRATLAARSKAYGKPVLLTPGGRHCFRIDKPLVLAKLSSGSAALQNFKPTATFGPLSVHWVELFVDVRDSNGFSVVPHLVPGNVHPRRRSPQGRAGPHRPGPSPR